MSFKKVRLRKFFFNNKNKYSRSSLWKASHHTTITDTLSLELVVSSSAGSSSQQMYRLS